jgi:hypothetical protein
VLCNVGSECAIRKIDIVVRPGVYGNSNFRCRHDERNNSTQWVHYTIAGQEDRRFSTCFREQSIRENSSGSSGDGQTLDCKRGPEFSESAMKPREGVPNIKHLRDSGYRYLFDTAVLEARCRYRLIQKVSQGCYDTLCARKALLQPIKMRRNEVVTDARVRSGENCPNLCQRHIQIAESADDLSRWNLGGCIRPIASLRVHVCRRQKTTFVVTAERPDAQVGRLSEITDSKEGWHKAILRSPPGGESNTQMRLDSPFAPAPMMVTSRKEEPNMGIELKGIIAEYVRAVNAHDQDTIMATFARDAYVNDNRRHMAGVDAIQGWVAKEVVGDKLTIDVREVMDHYGDTIVIGAYDGTFDRTNLPKELILTSYFSVRDNRIVSLTIIFNQRSPY